MKSVVVGSGGREHAIAHVLGRDSDVTVTPGNPGIPNSTTQSPLNIDADLATSSDLSSGRFSEEI